MRSGTWPTLALWAVLSCGACERKTNDDATPASSNQPSPSTTSPEAANGPTLCRDGGLYDREGRGLPITTTAIDRDARLALYGIVASVVPNTPDTPGTVDLARSMCARYEVVRACFLEEMKATPDLEGTLDLAITVRDDGHVAATEAKGGTLSSPALLTCLGRVIASTLFFPVNRTFVYSLRAQGHPLLGSHPIAIVTPGVVVKASAAAPNITRANIVNIVAANMARLEACYERGLAIDRTMKGTMGVAFVIEGNGTVSHVATTSAPVAKPSLGNDGSLSDEHVVSCVLGVFGGLVFPAPTTGSLDVVMPLAFANTP